MEFTKRAECVAYLVANGAHPGMAKAAIDQYCNYDADTATDDAIRRGLDDCDESCVAIDSGNTDDFVACKVDEKFVVNVYYTAASMMIVWGGLIYFDNEPLYYEDGSSIPTWMHNLESDKREAQALDHAHYTGTPSLFIS